MMKHKIMAEARKDTDRPPDLMILCFIILPNPLRRNSARPAMKQIVSSTEATAPRSPLLL